MSAVENFYPHHSIRTDPLSAKICPPPPTYNSTFFPFCVSTNTVLAYCWTPGITFCVLFSSFVCLKTFTLTTPLLSKLCTRYPNIWTQCWWRHMSLALSTPVFGMGVLLACNIWAFSWPAGTTLPNIATKAPYAALMVKKHYLNCIDYKCPLSPGPIASCFCPLLTKEVPYTRAHPSSAVTNGIWVASTAFLILLIALSLTTAQEKKCESLVDGRNLFAREQSEP